MIPVSKNVGVKYCSLRVFLVVDEELRKNCPSCWWEEEKVVETGMVGKIRGYTCDGSHHFDKVHVWTQRENVQCFVLKWVRVF